MQGKFPLPPLFTGKPLRLLNGWRRLILFLSSALLTVTAGCTLPPCQTNLDDIIKQELGLDHRPAYGYRCTTGAHRGASAEHRENTLAALLAADKSEKFAFIEFDVQYSKDNRIVVFHDQRLLRLFGSPKAISNTSFAELKELTGGEIAAYDRVMDLLSKKINIEIKSQGNPGEDRRLADEIIADIRQRKRDSDVLISSIDREVITYIKNKYPAIKTGQIYWLTSSTYLHFDGLTRGLYEELSASKADYLMLHVANLRNIEDLLKLKPRGKTIIFWDFDDRINLVHKDITDRLWGDSGVKVIFQSMRHALFTLFQGRDPGKAPVPARNPEINA